MRIEWHRCRLQKVNDENGRFIWKVTLKLNEGQINTCLWNGFECDVNCWPQISSKQSYICWILKCLFTKCYKVSYLNEQTMKRILKQILDISFQSENYIYRSYLVHRKIKTPAKYDGMCAWNHNYLPDTHFTSYTCQLDAPRIRAFICGSQMIFRTHSLKRIRLCYLIICNIYRIFYARI